MMIKKSNALIFLMFAYIKLNACVVFSSYNQLSISIGNQFFSDRYIPTLALSKEFDMNFTQSRHHNGINYMWIGLEKNAIKSDNMMALNLYLFKLSINKFSMLSPGVNYLKVNHNDKNTISVIPSIQYQLHATNKNYLTPKLSIHLGYDINKNKLRSTEKIYLNLKLMLSLNFKHHRVHKGNFRGHSCNF